MSATSENSLVSGDSSDDRLARIEQMLSGSFLFDDVRQRMADHQARPLCYWPDKAPPPTRKRLVGTLVKGETTHLDDYRAHLQAKADGAKHVKDAMHRLRRILRLCRANWWRQLSPAVVQAAIAKLKLVRAGRNSLGLATVNHHIHSLKGFCNWFVNDYRGDRSPCLSLRPYNARLDVRRARRALTREECIALIKAANAGPTIAGIPGFERGLMYELACTTGLRAGELESLTRASFVLDGPEPHVIVEAAYSKHRRRDVVPLRADTILDVRNYLNVVQRNSNLFRRPGNGNGTYALRLDLRAAGIPYCVDGKYADHHAQRHTFVSNLFDSGATPKEAQTLARHQDARLTLGRYAHVTDKARRAAVERLPSLHQGRQEGDEAARI